LWLINSSEKFTAMKKNAFVFGLLSGLVITIMMVYTTIVCYNNADFEGNMWLGYAGMLIAFSFIFVGVKNLRDKQYNGIISFGKAFKMGLLITLIASSVYVLVWLIEYYFFIPDFMDKYNAHMLKEVQKEGASQAVIDQKIADMAKFKALYKNPVFVILITYTEVLPVGIIVSLICALILKRKEKRQPLTQ
jgi:hypothetical protein